jgi:dCTP diphosphatase
MDESKTLKEIKDKIVEFRDKRGWQDNKAKDLAISVVLEASELLEHFQWGMWDEEEVKKDPEKMEEIHREVADVIIYLIAFCTVFEIDISDAIMEKLEWNEKKYPVSKFNPHWQDREYYYKVKREYRDKNGGDF